MSTTINRETLTELLLERERAVKLMTRQNAEACRQAMENGGKVTPRLLRNLAASTGAQFEIYAMAKWFGISLPEPQIPMVLPPGYPGSEP